MLVDYKNDKSPVSQADREIEEAIRNTLNIHLPFHGCMGEEGGFQAGRDGKEEYCWVVDPIDGTTSFVTGKPTFGTLIALLRNGRPVLGVLDQAISQERWVGAQGRPTTLNGTPVKCRMCPGVAHAAMYSTSPYMFTGDTEEAYRKLALQVRMANFGADCYAYGLLAAGFCDIVAEASMKPYDYLALVPIVEGAGGMITDWNGEDLTYMPSEDGLGEYQGTVLAAASQHLHSKALDILDYF